LIRDFQDLSVWNKAVDLAAEIYQLTRRFPTSEQSGVVSQVRRASVSVSTNIAEGSGRRTTSELLAFLAYARGSLYETRSLLIVSQRLGFLASSDCAAANELMDETGKMLSGLRTKLQSRVASKKKRH
jgi:four helix bundle protein